MRILIVNHNGGSIYHGPNLRTFYAARSLVEHGHDVSIISSSYSHKYNSLPSVKGEITKENIDGVNFYWVKCIEYKNVIQRVFSHFQFGFKILRNKKKICDKADLVLFSGPPPEIFFFSWVLAKHYECQIVSDVRDLWPKTQVEMSKLHFLSPYTYLLYAAQWAMVRWSSALVTPLPGAYKYFDKIDQNKKVFTIENGFSFFKGEAIVPDSLNITACSKNLPFSNLDVLGIDDIRSSSQLIVGYSGAFDRDNDIDSIMSAIRYLSNRDDVMFVFLGDGKRKKEIVQLASENRNVLVLSRVDSRFVPMILDCMDICYCGLKPKSIYQYGVSLAKSYEYMAAKKPIIWMIDAYNNPVENADCGYSVSPGDVGSLISTIDQASKLPKDQLREMGNSGYNYLCENHSYKVLGKQWNSLVESFEK